MTSDPRASRHSDAADAATARFVAEVRAAVDQRLDELLVEAEARASDAGPDPRALVDALGGLVRRGGKRIRPVLLAAAARACGRPLDRAVVDAGCAWELLQAYFLIHDDWMDGDEIRRGGPAVHVSLSERYGDRHLGAASAILAGDLANALAHTTLAGIEAPAPIVRDLMVAFVDVHRDVVLGQALDLTLASHDAKAVERMHALKTGSYTTRGPLLMGAVLAGATPRIRQALARFAEPIGVAFQLTDDLLGVFGDEATTGKPVGSDLRSRKRTALVAEALARLDAAGRERLERLLVPAPIVGGAGSPDTHGDAGDAEITWARTAIETCGARASIEARAQKLLDEAHAELEAIGFDPQSRAILWGLARALVERRA